MRNIYSFRIFTVILFIILFVLGLFLAQLKPLWNDELYSQVFGIEKLSYFQIWLGEIPEGNNSPLFYVLQKIVCDIGHYHIPFVWNGDWSVADPAGQFILRVMPVLFMSLALTGIFFFFASEYSLWTGAFAIGTALATLNVWAYWAEARPYAQWFALSTFQLLCFLKYVRCPESRPKIFQSLIAIHLILSLTSVFGSVQVFVVSMMIYVFYERKFLKFTGIFLIPMCCGFYYFLRAPHYMFGLPPDFWDLIWSNFPPERLALFVFCGILAGFSAVIPKNDKPGPWFSRGGILAALFLGASAVLMVCLNLTRQKGLRPFEVSSRYFIFLSPLGIILTTVFFEESLKLLKKYRWMTVNLILLGTGLLIIRAIKVTAELSASGIY